MSGGIEARDLDGEVQAQPSKRSASRAPFTWAGVLLLAVGVYLMARPYLPITDADREAAKATAIELRAAEIFAEDLAKVGTSEAQLMGSVEGLQLLGTQRDLSRIHATAEVGRDPPDPLRYVNMQLLAFGQTATVVGALLLAVAWRPGR